MGEVGEVGEVEEVGEVPPQQQVLWTQRIL